MNAMHLRETIAAVLMLIVGLAIISHCTGCAPSSDQFKGVIEKAQVALPYGFSLDACRDEAKKKPKPQQFEAYLQCEDLETIKLCRENPRLRAAWKACLEVEQ